MAAARGGAQRAARPAPEALSAATPDARRAAHADGHRPGFDDVVWFRMDVGRRHNADPRWLLPLICRRGHVTRGEIGAIRVGPGETWFQIPRAVAAKFAGAVARTANADGEDESGIRIEQAPGEPPRAGGRGGPPAGRPQPARHAAKPYRGRAPAR